MDALKLRGANPQDSFRQEDIDLLCSYTQKGARAAEILQIFELLTGKHKNKELQQYFDSNKDLQKKPIEMIQLVKTTNHALFKTLTAFQCKEASKEIIRVYMESLNFSNLN